MENYVLIQCVIDSGAGASVGPRGLALKGNLVDSAGSKAGQTFTSASGKVMKNEGEVSLNCITNEGTGMTAVFPIADITRPLLSVSKICEMGNLVSFGQMAVSYIMLSPGSRLISAEAMGFT